jgi:riboflavin biosynthesis pyrimidine reductase
MVMGLLRAAADAIIIGASTLERSPQHIWTAEYVYPPLASAYRTLRQRMGKDASPLIVIVSGRGSVGPAHPVFSTREAQSVIVTTEAGSREITKRGFNPGVHLLPAGAHHPLSPREILDAVASERPRAELILVEGGPHLLGEFLGGERLDELFLTLSPQIAGRMNGDDRLALVAGKTFAPGRPLWARLVALKRAESHLFLRYAFTWAEQRS